MPQTSHHRLGPNRKVRGNGGNTPRNDGLALRLEAIIVGNGGLLLVIGLGFHIDAVTGGVFTEAEDNVGAKLFSGRNGNLMGVGEGHRQFQYLGFMVRQEFREIRDNGQTSVFRCAIKRTESRQ